MKGQCYQNLPYPTKALKSKAEPLFKNDGSHFTNSHRTFFDFTCKSNRNLVSSINSIPSWISPTYPPLIRKKNPEILSLRSNPTNCSSTALAPIWPNRNWNSWSGLGHHQKNFHKFPCHSIHPISFSLSLETWPLPLSNLQHFTEGAKMMICYKQPSLYSSFPAAPREKDGGNFRSANLFPSTDGLSWMFDSPDSILNFSLFPHSFCLLFCVEL